MHHRGLTIIEVLFSMIILAVTLAGGTSIYFYLTALTAQATHKDIAIQLANSKMEHLKTLTCDSLIYESNDPGDPDDFVPIKIGSLDARQTVSTGTTVCPFLEVAVKVNWSEPSKGNEEVLLVTNMAY